MSLRLGLCTLWTSAIAGAALGQIPLRSFQGSDYGVVLNGEFGSSIAGVGDIDRDGHDDLAVGARNDTVGGVAAGRVRVISGADGALLFTFDGMGVGSGLGSAVAGPGDVNRDGWPDILVGAPGDDLFGTDSGTARLYSGRTGEPLYVFASQEPGTLFGTAVAGAGDMNGDGHPDLIVGAPATFEPSKIPYVDVLSGRDGSLIYRAEGTSAAWAFGVSVTGAGDLDGDGLGDIVVGETRITGGAIHALIGPMGAIRKTRIGGRYFGTTVRRIGDLNGDGAAEILVAANGSGPQRSAYAWDTVSNTYFLSINTTISGFGESGDGPGDMNGDGIPDFVVGSPEYEGAAHVYSGKDAEPLWDILNLGDSRCDQFGSSVAAAGDVDGDGHPDVAVGAPYDSPFGNCWSGVPSHPYGSVLVFSMQKPYATNYCTAKVNSQGCAPRMGSTGSPTATGPDDFVVFATDAVNHKSGLLLWSRSPASTPFGGGTLCIGEPLQRTPVQSSGGSPPPPGCTGTFQFHFRQVLLWKHLLFAGSRVHAQYWYRDQSSGGIGLTDGLDWIVGY